ncbi:condensin-2 complex subunit D3-like [Anticarsia gemmatalis]|uniref:condensin-2 complex subunit D3-like n=1 Tax=Anticarsia gemmatalis TaxID=129554 RepID=UPI003F760583
MAQVVIELNNLGLEFLDHGWVQNIYQSEFLEFGELPTQYETVAETLCVRSTFEDVMKSVDDWLNSEAESGEEKTWAYLSRQVEHEKVLALLAYYVDIGNKNVTTKNYRNNALLASRVYYKLLSIPGFMAYHIYHSQLFAQSLTCLSFPKAMCDNESSYFNTRELTSEVNSVIRELRPFVLDLRAIIEHLQLNHNDMNFEDILSNLVDVTGGAIVNKLHVDKIELGNLSKVIYEIIDILICDGREPNATAIRLLFKCLLPKLIAASVDTRNANNIVRASYVTYSGLLLSKYSHAALNGYMVLLQHLCYSQDGLERSEVRNARVSLVSGLMSLLPPKAYRKIVKWVLQLSKTYKVPHRQIALELMANLLSNDPEEPRHVPPQDNENNANDGPQGNIVTEDESSQDSEVLPQVPVVAEHDEILEDINAGLFRQRPHTVPHAEILHAVYARVHDVSSTLRTRALLILADCLANPRPHIIRAVKELNGEGEVSRLMAVGARSVCDERAAVRRAGAALVQRLLAAPRDPPQGNDLAILVSLCRDASILVRSSAIGALGELVTEKPSEAVFDAFLSGPMHQLSDPENRIQDQVVTLIHHLLTDRLQKFVSADYVDRVPWMFLAGITRRNMRRHLQKACTMMAKKGNAINHRLVDILSSHLGAVDDERDLQCLVMLTSVARHVDYSNVGFVINYYYKLSDNEENRDVRLLLLTLELIGTWSRYAQDCERTSLRDHLVRRLAAPIDDGCRIPCATLAAHLDPANVLWATDLMQLSESRAIDTGDIDEALRAVDLSLVAPAPPSPELLRLFLNALNDPPPEWSGAMLGSCVAGAGRLCVRARGAAVLVAPALGALLPAAAAPLPARVNALLALTDICIRYTSIVEPLLGCVCECLAVQSPAALRRTAARALTRLLLGGFLRLRTPLYYKYCALLADEDHDVREPAEYYVTCCLTADSIYHHFVDCVIHYNKEDTEKISFDARQLVYDVMLQRLSIVQKLNVQCRLARDVLEHAADLSDEGDEELPPDINAAILDTITLLCGPRMRLPKKPQNAGEAADIDELQERVTTNIVSHKMKRTVAEVLVPAVLRLYSRLRARGGQLAAYLVRIATDLLVDYRQEIEELIENDEDLVERVQQFQETIGQSPTFGNARNLVTTSAPPEPDTPRAPRRRPRQHSAHTPRKRALRI